MVYIHHKSRDNRTYHSDQLQLVYNYVKSYLIRRFCGLSRLMFMYLFMIYITLIEPYYCILPGFERANIRMSIFFGRRYLMYSA